MNYDQPYEDFKNAYVRALLQQEGEQPTERSILDIAGESYRKIDIDVKRFFIIAYDLIMKMEGYSFDQAGRDFWRTRNGCSNGFRFKKFGDAGQMLTTIAKTMGVSEVYLGDDEMIHVR